MSAGDILKVTKYLLNGVTAIDNTFYYRDNGSSHVPDTNVIATDFTTLYNTAFLPVHQSDTISTGVRVEVIAGPNKGFVHVKGDGTAPGELVGLCAPSEIAISMTRTNGLVGRKNRGRIFFGPVQLSLFDGLTEGVIDVANADLITAASFVISTLNMDTVDWEPVLVGRVAGVYVVQPNGISQGLIQRLCVHRVSRRERTPS